MPGLGEMLTGRPGPDETIDSFLARTLLDPDIVERGSLLPIGKTASGGVEFATPEIGLDFVKALLLPSHALTGGRVRPEDVSQMALDVAGGGVGGSAAAGARGGLLGANMARKKLAMDEASRMARAEKMGFDLTNQFFHGTRGDIKAFDRGLFGSNTMNPLGDLGVSVSSSPELAGAYARSLGARKSSVQGGNIVPLLVRAEKSGTLDLTQQPLPVRSIYQTIDNAFHNDGFDVVRLVGDTPESANQINLIVKNPNQLRSRFAKFDPDKIDSDDLLAMGGSPILSIAQSLDRSTPERAIQ